jgi:hypothetical protein
MTSLTASADSLGMVAFPCLWTRPSPQTLIQRHSDVREYGRRPNALRIPVTFPVRRVGRLLWNMEHGRLELERRQCLYGSRWLSCARRECGADRGRPVECVVAKPRFDQKHWWQPVDNS